jgi:N-acetylglutamate synthase-like GNAT family acetyltransferase
MELKPGTHSQLNAILMESHALWGKGFAKEDYLKYHLLLRKRPWSKDHYRHLVLEDRVKRPVCACKVFGMNAVVNNKPIRIAQIGSVFTPNKKRSKGMATELINRLIIQLRQEGFSLALLFSTTSPEIFARQGFQEIEKYDLSFNLLIPAEPVRKVSVARHKVPERVKVLYKKSRSPLFSIERGADYWDMLRYKKTLFNRLQWDLGKESLYLCEDGSAYAWTLWTGQRLEVKDVTYKEPGALADIFAYILQRHGPGVLRNAFGWLPPDFEDLPFIKSVKYVRRETDVLMMKDLTGKRGKPLNLKPYDLQFWKLDQL